MSWLNKLLKGRDRSGAVSRARPGPDPPSGDALGALHLRKLFIEYYNMPPDEAKEQHLIKMLPVFCKLFASARPNEIAERFGEVSVFARDVSLLLVTEIRRHATSTDTHEASASLAHFLENHSDEGKQSNGWNILNTINILASCERPVIETVASTTLPSTLVKSLYLFLDLPPSQFPLTTPYTGSSSPYSGPLSHRTRAESSEEKRNRLKRSELHKVFAQALARLCRHVAAAEDIMRQDDLTKLFGIITSSCVRHNHCWRKTASDLLITITRHALTPDVVSHIHNHACIALCIRNMQFNKETSPLEIVEMFVSVYSCLKDSSELTYLLLDDFRYAQGYRFLTEFLIEVEKSPSEESQEAVRNMVLLVSSLVVCGFHDLQPPTNVVQGQPFQDSSFKVPEVSNPGLSVKNILAFKVLETGFLTGETSHLCGVILDVIFNIYSSDAANYFVLEKQHTLPRFIEKVYLKPVGIQEQVFKVLEYVACSLNYVPIPEIISVSILLKTSSIPHTLCIVLQSMIKLVSFNARYQDVFRDLGVIDALVWNIHQYAASLKEGTDANASKDTAEEHFVFLLMECLRVVLEANEINGNLFRESGGARCVQNMVPYAQSRREALKLVQQLVLLPGGHDDLGTLLGLMNSAKPTAVKLKTDVLRAVQRVFNLAARTKSLFREADGFVYVVSVLTGMGGSLSSPAISVWNDVDRQEMLTLLRCVCSVLNAAMQDEPANKHYFQKNIGFHGLVKPFLYLGCLGVTNSTIPSVTNSPLYRRFQQESSENSPSNANIFVNALVLEKFHKSSVYCSAELFRLLRDMALDTVHNQSPSLYPASIVNKPLHLSEIAHPGAIMAIVDLLPAIEANPEFDNCSGVDDTDGRSDEGQLDLEEKRMYEEWVFGLQVEIVNTISQLALADRNCQSLCQAGLTGKLLERCGNALADERHPLHAGLQRLFERLSLQALTPADVRNFLRLGDPLNCASSLLADHIVRNQPSCDLQHLKQLAPNYGKPVEFSRIQSLVTMATPRDGTLQGPDSCPPFVEFDMSSDGYGYLYLPSISPQSSSAITGVSIPIPSAVGSVSNFTSLDRPFPPPNGLTFSAWVYVDRLGTVADQHPIRLLTLVKKTESVDGKKTQHCLSVFIASGGLVVTTNDTELEEGTSESRKYSKPSRAFFQCEAIATEGQWRHVVVVLSRGVLRSSNAALYVDGQHIESVKLPYIAASSNATTSATETTHSPILSVPSSSSSMIVGYIGTRPKQRRISRLVWRLGPTYLLEDPLSSGTILCMYLLGPVYCGSFQAPYVETTASRLQQIEDAVFLPAPGSSSISSMGEALGSLVAEDKVSFGLNASAQSKITFRDFQQQHNDVDVNAARKELGITRHDLDWPIHLLHNTTSHLSGPVRTFGAIVMSRSGIRCFHPRPIHHLLDCVGGTFILLGLIAKASTVDSLYASVKALVCVLRGNGLAMNQMERNGGFGILGMLYKIKSHLLNNHILHLTFSLVGTIDSDRECSRILYVTAFHDLLGNLEVWSEAAEELQRSLYNHLFELVTLSSEKHTNAEQLYDMQMVHRLLQVLHRNSLSDATIKSVANVLSALLLQVRNRDSLLSFGQFVASLLPPRDLDELKMLQSEQSMASQAETVAITSEDSTYGSHTKLPSNDALVPLPDTPLGKRVHLRNVLLELLASLLHDERLELETRLASEVMDVLGSDWLLAFMQCNVHHTTVTRALRIVAAMLRHPVLQQRFQDGTMCGNWTVGTNESGKRSPVAKSISEIRPLCIPDLRGYHALSYLLPPHVHCSHIFIILLAVLLGRNIVEIPMTVQLVADGLHRAFDIGKASPSKQSSRIPGVRVNSDMALVLLVILRSLLSEPSLLGEDSSKCDYPVVLLQFFVSLYQSLVEFAAICTSREFIDGLTASVFPLPRVALQEPTEEFIVLDRDDSVPTAEVDLSSVKSSSLISHPAKQTVFDFLCKLVIDNLRTAQIGKGFPILEAILEASPDGCSSEQQSEFQTSFILSLLNHLVVVEILSPNSSSFGKRNNFTQLLPGVAVVLSRVGHRLWTGVITRDHGAVLMPVLQLMEQSKSSHQSLSLEDLYHPLNRIVLFLISRPCMSVTEQTSLLDTLHTITRYHKLILSSANGNLQFLSCLCHCLVCLANGKSCSELQGRSAYRRLYSSSPDGETEPDDNEVIAPVVAEANRLVQTSAARVWDKVLDCKRIEMQEIFNCDLPQQSTKSRGPPGDTMGLAAISGHSRSIKSLQSLFEDQAAKTWLIYEASEAKLRGDSSDQKRKTIVQRITGFRQRRDKTKPGMSQHIQDYLDEGAFLNLHLVQEVVEFQRVKFQQNAMYMFSYMQSQWAKIESDLTRERGLWGPITPSPLDKWILDYTEGPHRMRKKLCWNENFYEHYDYKKSREPGVQTKYKPANSRDSELYYWLSLCQQEQCEMSSLTNFNSARGEIVSTSVKLTGSSVTEQNVDTASVSTRSEVEMTEFASSVVDSEGFEDVLGEPVQQQLHQLLEEGEKIRHKLPCARIEGLDVIEGLFIFGQSHFYIIDGLTVIPPGEITDLQSLPEDSRVPVIPVQEHSSHKAMQPTSYPILCHKWSFNDVIDLHKRRYLLMDIAIEIFASDGRNQFVALGKAERNKVHARLLSSCRVLSESQESALLGMKREGDIEANTGLFGTIIGGKSVTQKWERGELSNFQYLMFLNTLAGRSYSDLMQYPIFPWVLKDYDSEELDLTSPETFRDFSKPMGAQTPERLKQFINRYSNWEDTTGGTPPYHYGTHYSSAMTVASYLIRLEPFAQHFLRLQGGHFDIADRLFHSIKEGWLSASEINMADVKELAPEFFYLPEFLINSNNFDLGTKQNGGVLGDVLLPPWAKGDPYEFIRMHREALECDYVSAHLHEWIDLIFGYKQQGPAAHEAYNVFHHLFYEGTVDIDKINDPLTRNATIGFINNFGQMPKQLCKRPHPSRKVKPVQNVAELSALGNTITGPSATSSDRLFYHHLRNLLPSVQPVRELRGPVGQIIQTDRAIIAVERNKILVPPHYVRYLAWGFHDYSLRGAVLEGEKVPTVYENLHFGQINCALCLDSLTLITAGESTVVCVWRLVAGSVRERSRQLQPKKTLYGHTAPVTCLALSQPYSILVSGSEDQTCIIWDVNRWSYVRQLPGHVAPVAAIAINNLTGDIVTCASSSVYLWSINGRLLADLTFPEGPKSSIQCCTVSELCEWDSQNVILTGGIDGIVRMFSVEFEPDINVVSMKQKLLCQADRRLTEIIHNQMHSCVSSQPVSREVTPFDTPLVLSGQEDKAAENGGTDSESAISTVKLPEARENLNAVGIELTAQSSEDNASSGEAVSSVNDGVQSGSERKSAEQKPTMIVNPFLRKRSEVSGRSWRRVLAERAKLTMHTAIDRPDNKHPAAISCLSVSRDHRTLLVGDERGRIYSWSVTEASGKRANHWVRDEVALNCAACNVAFTLTERRHHCRDCGQIFCHKCSKYESKIDRLGINKPVRVCQQCYGRLQSGKLLDPMRNA